MQKFLTFFVSLLIIAALIIGAVWWVMQVREETSVAPNGNGSVVDQTPNNNGVNNGQQTNGSPNGEGEANGDTQDEQDATASWETYANTSLGFSIKYPRGTDIDELSRSRVRLVLAGDADSALTVEQRALPDGQSLRDYASAQVKAAPTTTPLAKPLTITRLDEGIAYSYALQTDAGIQNVIMLPKDEQTALAVTFTGSAEEERAAARVTQALATFSLLE